MRKVEVCSYQEEWPLLFEKEAEKLQRVFRNELIAIHHIGSTSVPGLQAKPVIDMLPVVNDIQLVANYNQKMRELDYEPMGEYEIPGRRFFRKGGDKRTHHIHIFQIGSDEITRHLAFRDYLRKHPEDKKRYGDLKMKLAQQFPDDMESYIKGKERLVKEIERKGLTWYQELKKQKSL